MNKEEKLKKLNDLFKYIREYQQCAEKTFSGSVDYPTPEHNRK